MKDNKVVNRVILCALILSIGVLIGVLLTIKVGNLKHIEELKDFSVYVEEEQQVFRNRIGKKVYPVNIDGYLYLPYSELGSYLGYMTIEENGLHLYEIEDTGEYIVKDFKTESYEGTSIDSSIFKDAEYTMFFVWATWCPDCEEQIKELSKLNDYFSSNNIQILSVVVDSYNELEENKVKEKAKGLNIDHYLYTDSVIMNKLIGNAAYIPKMVIVDNEGRLVKIFEKNLTSDEVMDVFDNMLGVKDE